MERKPFIHGWKRDFDEKRTYVTTNLPLNSVSNAKMVVAAN
jgi:hypothetical protein